jgi:REP element-mobilizing transposase RayT
MQHRYDPQRHRRRSIRLAGWDYTSAAVYFVTICTHQRANLFDDPRFRQVAEGLWRAIPHRSHADHVSLDEWILMPNHLHGLILLGPADPGAPSEHPPSRGEPAGVAPGSLGAIIGNYKSVVTRRINQLRDTPGAPVWHRNYCERIVRNQRQLDAFRRYIIDNPARWATDGDNPDYWLGTIPPRR